MLKKVMKAFVFAAFFFSIVQNSSYAQDTSPAANRLKLKKLTVKGIKNPDRFSEWMKIDDSSSMAFIEDYSKSTDTRSLYSMPISSKGKVGKPVKLIKDITGWFDQPSALWIPEHNRGLVFVPYANNDGPLKIVMITIDKNGKILAEPITPLTIKPPAGSYVQFAELKAVRGSNRIGVFITASFWSRSETESHYNGCTVRFLKTYLTGKPTAPAINIPLPGKGKLRAVTMDDAAFNGGTFLAPMVVIHYETYKSTFGVIFGRPINSTFYVFSAPENTSKVSDIGMKQIAVFPKDNFGFPFIIPESGGRSILFYSTVKMIPEAKMKLDYYEMTYFIQKIDSSGAKIKRAKKVKMPGWQHKIAYDPAKDLHGYSIDTSEGILAGDGTFFVAQTFCLRRRLSGVPGSNADYEQLFRVLNISTKTGKVKIVSESSDTRDLFFGDPFLLNLGKNLAILNQGYPSLPQDNPTVGYYSKYRLKAPLN